MLRSSKVERVILARNSLFKLRIVLSSNRISVGMLACVAMYCSMKLSPAPESISKDKEMESGAKRNQARHAAETILAS